MLSIRAGAPQGETDHRPRPAMLMARAAMHSAGQALQHWMKTCIRDGMAQTVLLSTRADEAGERPPAPPAPGSGKDDGTGTEASAAQPFSGGPLYKIQGVVGLLAVDKPNVLRRALFAMALCWLPLAFLTALPGHDNSSFWPDFGTHARYLIVVPLLIIAEGICIPRIGALASHFLESEIVADAQRQAFLDIIASTQRLLNMLWIEVAVIVLAYLCIAAIYEARPFDGVPAWITVSTHVGKVPSPAGWWGLLVSLPVMLCLLLSWVWRLCLWGRFLYLVSRLELRLIPVHPDGAAGLGFVGYSSQAFAVLATALGVLVAGAIANSVYAGASLTSYHYLVLFFVVGVVLFFNLPLLVFLDQMLRAWRRGTLQYGGLADRFGLEFERKWLHDPQIAHESMMDRPDFSSATDLYQVVDRVYAMWLVPIHPKSVAMLAVAAFVPFIPVALMALPFDDIVDKLTGLLF
ncbi:hypothetical protein ACFQPC_01815 [Herminiimonas glaciei]|uniref:Uncharacterized protein n=1 Tax=Herminiimonas glaciei TaxID=523788 RepID=A0ABW2I746_9BURK